MGIGAPSVHIDMPAPGSTVSGVVTVAGWAIDNATTAAGTAIGSMQVKVDGVAVGSATYGVNRPDVCNVYPGRPGCPNVGFSYQLNTATLSPGSHTITVTATDTDGNPDVGLASVTISVTSYPPSVHIDAPAPNAVVSGTIAVTGWALDNSSLAGGAISSVQVKVDGAAVGNANYGASRPDVCNVYPGRTGCPNVGFSYQLNTAAMSSGSHTITVSATDTDGTPDVGSTTATVTVQSSVVIVSPANVALAGSQTQQFTASVANNSNTAVTWSLSPSVGSISAAGLYSAPATISSAQPVTVTAISVADPTKTASATITLVPTVTIQSVPAGLQFAVDNSACVSPCVVHWVPGSSHILSAGTQLASVNTQYVFASWSQGGTATQTISAPSTSVTYTATFTAQYLVSTFASPSPAGGVTLTPPGGWYAAGAQVTAGATVNPGWAFTGLTGGTNNPVAPQVLTVTAPVSLTANFTPDFSLSVPTPVTTVANGTVSFPVTVTGQNGFNDTVTFDAPILPAGATASFNPPTVTGSGTSTVTIHAPAPGGTFAFTIRGTGSSGVSHGTAGNLAVQDFTVTTATPTLSGGAGDTVQYVFNIGSLGGFNGSVSIAYPPTLITPNPIPSGNDKHCSPYNFSQQSGTGTVTLTIPLGACDLWSYNIGPLTFVSGAIRHQLTVQLQGVTTAFTLSTSAAPPTFSAGVLATFPIHVASNSGGQFVSFNPPVTPCGVVRSSPGTVSPPGDTSFTLDTTGCVPGSYVASVSAQSTAGVTQGLGLPFIINTAAPPDFSVAASPTTRTVAAGASDVYTLNVTPMNGFIQTVSFTVSNLPAGVTASFPAGSTVNGFGTVSLHVSTTASAASGSFTVTGTASDGRTRSVTLSLNVATPQPGFTLRDIPTINLPADGRVVAVPVTVTPLNNSTATVRLRSISGGLPVGINVRFSDRTMMLSASANVPPGDYALLVEGDDGSGNTGHCGGHIGVGTGVGAPTPGPASVISHVSSPDGQSDPATLINGVSGNLTITGQNFGVAGVSPYVMICQAAYDFANPINGPPCFPPGMIQRPEISTSGWTDNTINLTVTMPAAAIGPWKVNVAGVYHFLSTSFGSLQVYDATPTITSVQSSTPPASGPFTVTIAGAHFGPAQGTLMFCATSTAPCSQSTPDFSLSQIVWQDGLITVLVTPVSITLSDYCVRVKSLGEGGSQFSFAPGGASTDTSACGGDLAETPQAPSITLTPNKILVGVGGQASATASGSPSGGGSYSWELVATQPGDDPTVATISQSPTCTGQATCTASLQGVKAGKATLRAHFTSAGGEVTADSRVVVVQITALVLTVANNLDNGVTSKTSTSAIPASALEWPTCHTQPCTEQSALWVAPSPVVLIRGSVASVSLTATTVPSASDPDVNIAFLPPRDPDDAAGSARPSLANNGQGAATLSLDQTGTFQVLAYIDSNANGQWDPGETGLTIPVILVQATLNQNLSNTPSPQVIYTRALSSGSWGKSNVQSGFPSTCNLGAVKTCAVQLSSEVDLVGGGTDGLRGIDQVSGGWAQDLATPAGMGGTYQNNHLDTEVFASNVPPPPHDNLTFYPVGRYSATGDPDPQIISGPLLDSVNPTPGIGGNSSLMSTSQYQDATTAPPLGKRKLITALDDTRLGLLARHPIDLLSLLIQIQYNLPFSSFLTLWTSAADRTYGVLLGQPWNIHSTFGVDATGNGTLGAGVLFVYLGTPSCSGSGCAVLPLAGTGAVLTAPIQCMGASAASPCTIQNAQGSNYKQ